MTPRRSLGSPRATGHSALCNMNEGLFMNDREMSASGASRAGSPPGDLALTDLVAAVAAALVLDLRASGAVEAERGLHPAGDAIGAEVERQGAAALCERRLAVGAGGLH